MTPLTDARTTLCDLLIGRTCRLEAARYYARALATADLVQSDHLLQQAAHYEWIAVISERGQVGWGGRFNRCGYQPHEEVLAQETDRRAVDGFTFVESPGPVGPAQLLVVEEVSPTERR